MGGRPRSGEGVQEVSGGCASIPVRFRADCKLMVAALMYWGSLIALLRVRIATFQSRCWGVNPAIALTASPTVLSVVCLQTNSNASGLVLTNEIKIPS
jgi:hypothetical protein